MKLLIAIPALNEEESIEAIIQRSLEARERIIAGSSVTEVEITVVSDGSTDRTVELASRYIDRIRLIVFEENRGYGAAIMEAWNQTDADLLGILDADGTCDPNFFANLCNALVREDADVILGCRLNPNSEMPPIRVVGNFIFATMLTVFSSGKVRDSASGMRVVRKSSLERLKPLPAGLHFTPAMSARAILSEDLKIIEIDMPYEEREGQSKLSVAKDGIRFLKVIMEAVLLYRLSRPLGLMGVVCLIAAVALMLMPTLYYLQHGRVLEWMIYRFVVSELCGISACLLFCASYLSARIVGITVAGHTGGLGKHRILLRFFSSGYFWLIPPALMAAGAALGLGGFVELVTTGQMFAHWSRFIAMSFLFSVAIVLIITKAIDGALGLIADRMNYLKSI